MEKQEATIAPRTPDGMAPNKLLVTLLVGVAFMLGALQMLQLEAKKQVVAGAKSLKVPNAKKKGPDRIDLTLCLTGAPGRI